MRSIDGVVHVHPRGEEDPNSDPDLRISRRVTEDFQRRCGNGRNPLFFRFIQIFIKLNIHVSSRTAAMETPKS